MWTLVDTRKAASLGVHFESKITESNVILASYESGTGRAEVDTPSAPQKHFRHLTTRYY